MKHVKTFEAVINLSKEDMEILHQDGKVDKDGHTIEYNESVNEATGAKIDMKQVASLLKKAGYEFHIAKGNKITGIKTINIPAKRPKGPEYDWGYLAVHSNGEIWGSDNWSTKISNAQDIIKQVKEFIDSQEKIHRKNESVNEAKDNLYLQLHKKYAEQIQGLKAKKIRKLTDLVSVQRWSMEDMRDYFDLDSKKKKELSAEYNNERKLFKKYMAGDHSVLLPKGTETLAESVNEGLPYTIGFNRKLDFKHGLVDEFFKFFYKDGDQPVPKSGFMQMANAVTDRYPEEGFEKELQEIGDISNELFSYFMDAADSAAYDLNDLTQKGGAQAVWEYMEKVNDLAQKVYDGTVRGGAADGKKIRQGLKGIVGMLKKAKNIFTSSFGPPKTRRIGFQFGT